MADAPRVFLSYSHDSPEHAKRVLDLADALQHGGLEVVLDQYVHPAPDEGWPRWMEARLDEANFVLMVCTETYRRRVLGQEQPGKGLGVRWEGSLIYNRIYNDQSSGSRFIPVLLEGGEFAHIPNPVQGHTHYRISVFDISRDAGFEGLYRHLTGQPPTPPGEIGPIQTLPPHPRWDPSGNPLERLPVDQTAREVSRPEQTMQVEAASLPALKKAVDYLFDEGNQILQERRARRQAEGQEPRSASMTGPANESSPAGPGSKKPFGVIRTKEESLSQHLTRSAWTDHEKALIHLLTLLEIHTANYRRAQKKYAIWGDALVPPIIEHTLEEEASAIAVNYGKLHATLNKIYGKTIVVA